MDSLGLNKKFPILDKNGNPFHDLVLHKASVESVVMSLGDKIVGDVYYKNNMLDVTMEEYVEYDGVKYMLVNPPTIVKEGVVSNNSDLNGMTKYSFEFYHPMYWLNDYPFVDVATSRDENRYLSESKTFTWIGLPDDYIEKLNKNLEGTLWVVEKSERFPEDKETQLSEVLSFDNSTIADALKTFYETWGIPYVIEKIEGDASLYVKGKRFKVVLGLPSSEIYDANMANWTSMEVSVKGVDDIYYSQTRITVPANKRLLVDSLTDGFLPVIMEDVHGTVIGTTSISFTTTTNVLLGLQGSSGIVRYYIYNGSEDTYTFKCGKGVGLKNNSRTPRNNKIVTRIAGYGSEDNIPYGYPQVIWYGNPNATCTIGDSVGVKTNVTINGKTFAYAMSYPLYDGIVGGQWVKLIKHPFTRHHLMPLVYSECLFNKVSPYKSDGTPNYDFDPDTTLVDYYDAIPTVEHPYPNPINEKAPSYEIHQFEDIKPKLDTDTSLRADAVPVKNDTTEDTAWDDSQDGDGNYLQSYFKLFLPQLTFDLYACAAITQEMNIIMRSGACLGCKFPIQVDWEDYKKNFYDEDGNFAPYGSQRNYDKYPDSSQTTIDIIAQKEYETFGVIMPNIYQQPKSGDKFVITGISLPLSYIHDAEEELSDAMQGYMMENNIYYYDYPLKFDEYFLATNTHILRQLKPHNVVRFMFAGETLELYIKDIAIKYGESPLPQYNITLTDNIEVVLNQIGQVVDNVDKLSSLVAILRQSYGRNVWSEISKKLSKVSNDTAAGIITFLQGIIFGSGGYGITDDGDATLSSVVSDNFIPDNFLGSGWGAWLDENGISTFEVDNLNVRMKAIFNELEIRKVSSSGGNLLFTSAGSKIQKVVPVDANGNETTTANAVAFRCDLFSDDGTTATMNDWMVGDQARCQQFNIKEGKYQNVSNRSYWRKVIATEERYDEDGKLINSVILAKNSSGTYKGNSFTKGTSTKLSDYPQDNDTIVQLGNQTNASRQNAIELVANGENAPALLKYHGINDYTLDGKLIQGEYYNPVDHTFYSETYGNWYVGARESDADGGYAKYDESTRTFSVKGKLEVGSTLDDGRDVNALGTSRGNLLKNTGFTGDYESVDEEDGELAIDESTPIYSDPLKYWDATNVEVLADTDSASGYSAKLGVLSQTVDGGWKEGEWYMLSLRAAQGTLTIEAGGETKVATLTDWERIDFPFQASTTDGVVRLSGTAKVCEIMLTAGNLPTEWHRASTDNDKSMAEFFGLDYLRKAITDATTNIIGGLVMTQILKVGNYRGGQMSQETGGMSGAYNDDKSPFLWGGGTMEDAIYTIMKYAKNPAYQPTEEEVSRMAKFVVTHGGRAILNDIVLRGYIYALGGVFNGTVYATDGEFSGRVLANSGSFGGEDGMFKITFDADTRKLTIWGPDKVSDPVTMTPTADAQQIEYITIGKYGLLGTGQSGEYYVFPQIELKREGEVQGTTIVNKMTLDIFNGLTFTSMRNGVQTRSTSYTATGIGIDGDFLQVTDLPTSSAGLSAGQIWNDNGTLKIKS